MTREEAINWLDRLYMGADITDEYGDMVDMQPYEEAFNMAIKALEQEPCDVPDINAGDMISRQAVLDILDDMTKDYAKSNDFEKVNGVAWVKVQKLPSVNTTKTGRK